MAKTDLPANFESIEEDAAEVRVPPLWGSARFSYTICAFLAMVVQLCMRNTLGFVILCMVKPQPLENSNEFNASAADSDCGPVDSGNSTTIERSGDLLWSRSQEFALLGSFYYGYLITLPIAGRLADKFGGKLLFVHSLTVQALIFMLIPVVARISYTGAVIVRSIQGLIAGCSNPALYQLFSTWAHPSERTVFITIAYTGFSVGSVLVFPISSALCKYGWELVFYAVGSGSLFFGICCQWFVYSTLEDHPRLSKEEYDYLKVNNVEKCTTGVPWKSILTSIPVYAFIFTHVCHTYGIMVFSLLIPRFFKEAMRLPLDKVGLLSSAPFLGAFIAKAITISSCKILERRPNRNLTRLRRIVYVACNCMTILFIFGMIICTCKKRLIVVLITICIGITTDIAFAGAYWPSLLNLAPAFAGLISGLANCLATVSGFLAPLGISSIVRHGTKVEWDLVLASLMTAYLFGAISYGLFGSSKLVKWGQVANARNESPIEESTNISERV